MSVRLRSLLSSAATTSAGAEFADVAERVLGAGDDGPTITDVTHDSRAVRAGSLFCCVRGAVTDGHRYAADAVRAGATALLCERSLGTTAVEVQVADSRRSMAPLAAAMHGHPSASLDVIGVTGTNGKTTTTRMIAAILEHGGMRTASIGTLTGARTTPEAPELQSQLAEYRDDGFRAVAMEVSSHALELHRVDATSFAAVAFTNLSRDHLDFHGSMERYFNAKARLFSRQFAPFAVINVDTPHGKLLASTTDIEKVVRVGVRDIEIIDFDATGSRYRWRDTVVSLSLPGRFNVANAIVASEVCVGLGMAPTTAAEALAELEPVPGRFQRVAIDAPFSVIVDYAHTPDGLENLLVAAREIARDRQVIVVFGCGGDRDATKRPFMGRVARELADHVVVTSDNPRSEDPAHIAAEIVAGMERRPDAIELDRRLAIQQALTAARQGDVVIVAGKGHESVQQIGTLSIPFDDMVVVAEEAARIAPAGWS